MKPLADLKVLAFTHAVSGSYASRLFTEWGADLLKVEPPAGAMERDGPILQHYVNNRGKRSICVDLKRDEGEAVVHDLVESGYDVVITNYVPETAENLGIDYESLRAVDEGLVYCSLTGFGDDGPYREYPALDPIAQAMSGIMTMTGNPDRKPSRIGGSLIDIGAATNACLGVLLAVRHRDRTGEGQKVESSLFETAVGWGGEWCTYYTRYGEEPRRMGDKKATYAPVGAYATREDLVYLAALGDETWRNLCGALGLDELPSHPDYETAERRRENREELDSLIEAETRTYDRDELVETLLDHDVPASGINSIPEVIDDQHVEARDMLRDFESDEGDLLVPTLPMTLSRCEAMDAGWIPEVGEHTREALSEAGYSAADVDALVEDGVVE